MMQLPQFNECNHTIVKSLFHHNDRQLLTLFQLHPEWGRYFTAIFCRYYPIVYTLISQSARSPVQADYLFALTWRHIYYELRGLDLRHVRPDRIFDLRVVTPQKSDLWHHDADSNLLQASAPIVAHSSKETLTLQNWLIDITAICINRVDLPPVESIYYSLEGASPPLWCYIEQALEQVPPVMRLIILMAQTFRWSETRIAAYLQVESIYYSLEGASPPLWCYIEQALEQVPPVMRLIILMAQTFRWSETRIAAYLQAEGEMVSPATVKMQLLHGYQLLEDALPADIREIYLQSD